MEQRCAGCGSPTQAPSGTCPACLDKGRPRANPGRCDECGSGLDLWDGTCPICDGGPSTRPRTPSPSSPPSEDPSVRLVARGIAGSLELLEDRVRIRRDRLWDKLSHGLKGEKEIYFHSITSLQFKKCGWITNGYLQIVFPGSRETKGGLFDAADDENTVMFGSDQQPAFEAMRNAIQEGIAAARRPVPTPAPAPTVPALDLAALEQLASLRDRGILTEEEFTAKKRQILGL